MYIYNVIYIYIYTSEVGGGEVAGAHWAHAAPVKSNKTKRVKYQLAVKKL